MHFGKVQKLSVPSHSQKGIIKSFLLLRVLAGNNDVLLGAICLHGLVIDYFDYLLLPFLELVENFIHLIVLIDAV